MRNTKALTTTLTIAAALALGFVGGLSWERSTTEEAAQVARSAESMKHAVDESMAFLCHESVKGLAWSKTTAELKEILDTTSRQCDRGVLSVAVFEPYNPER